MNYFRLRSFYLIVVLLLLFPIGYCLGTEFFIYCKCFSVLFYSLLINKLVPKGSLPGFSLKFLGQGERCHVTGEYFSANSSTTLHERGGGENLVLFSCF